MRNAGLDMLQAGIKIGRRNINSAVQMITPLMAESKEELKSLFSKLSLHNLRYADDTTVMAESEEELKSLLMRMKGESERAGLKLNIMKTKNMASGFFTSWQIEGEKVEVVADFLFGL